MNAAGHVEPDPVGLCLSVGAGRESTTSKIVPLKPSAAALAAALQALPGVYEGWFALHRWRTGRKAPDWKSASGTIVDLDHHMHDPTGAKPKGIKAPPPPAWREKLEALIASGGLPGNVFHHTANGERVYLLFGEAVTDEATYRRAYHGACALVRNAMDAAGVPLCVNPGDGKGYEVDPSVEDLAQWFWSPRAIVDGQKRTGVPVVLREEPYSPAELGKATPARTESPRQAVKAVTNGVQPRAVYPTLAAARAAFNRDHTVEWDAPGKGTCPICGHNDCFGSLPDRPGKWFCFSEGHSGEGQRTERGWFGDALDVAAHKAGQSTIDHLRAEKYLAAEYREEPGCNDGDDEPPMPESENPPGTGSERQEKRSSGIEYVLTSMASVQPKPVRWLWRDRIAFGKITILDGDPGNGKSTIALDLAARLTTGRPMPGESKPVGPPMRVLLVSIEDDPADTLRPRLDAAGANCSLIDTLAIKVKGREVLPVLSDHLTQIEDAILESGAKLLILDPLSALMGRADMFKDQEVRSVLGPLKGVIERHAVANINIRHFNKSQGGASALYRGGGSIAIAASARSVLAVARNPQSPIQRVLAVSKGNGAEPQEVPSLAYSMEKVLVGDIETIRIRWEGVSAYTADELLAAHVPDSREERGALDEAKDFLQQVLAGGPLLSTDLEKQRKAAGVAESTLKRARGALSVKAKYIGGRWFVSLPDRSTSAVDPLDPLTESDGSP